MIFASKTEPRIDTVLPDVRAGDEGVNDGALLSVIRRWRLRGSLAIREISRRTGLSRTTIRQYLKTDIVEPKYPARKNASKLAAFEDKRTRWLESEPRKSRKQRRNVRQMTADLVALGYRGSYDRVAAYARQWRRRQRELERVAILQSSVWLGEGSGREEHSGCTTPGVARRAVVRQSCGIERIARAALSHVMARSATPRVQGLHGR